MSSAITTAGQTRINQLRGAELPLVIDRMVLALIPGLDPTQVVDRSQLMPPVEQIVHTATIDPDNKGYVDPDQVVYSVVLGSDVGNFSFNWIGLIEESTNTLIAITTTPETPKRKTNIGTNTTGNNITRNFMIQFQDAQNLTGIVVAAETWQFDYQADLTSHFDKVVDPSQAGAEKKHVTDSQAKKWEEHADSPHASDPPPGKIDWFDTDVAPSGYLKANGAVLPIAAYLELGAAVYVGDAENATAEYNYRCTDNLNPNTTRDINGAYIVIIDMRGEFSRGLDDGRGIDIGRKRGYGQLDDFKLHTHIMGSVISWAPSGSWTAINGGSGRMNDPTGATGGTETRPRNKPLLACIKY